MGERNTLYNDLEIIRKRPGMFIGGNSISKMNSFLDGYRFAVRENEECLYTEYNIPFWYFNNFVAGKFKESGCMGWRRIILQEVNDSEEKGLELFFKLLDEFKQLKITNVWNLELSEECVEYNLTAEGVPKMAHGEIDYTAGDFFPMYSDAKSIYKIMLSDNTTLLAVQRKEGSAKIEDDFFILQTGIDRWLERCFGKVAWKETLESFSSLRLVGFEKQ